MNNSVFYTSLAKMGLTPSWTFIKIGMSFLDYTYRIKPEEIVEYAYIKLKDDAIQDERALIDIIWSKSDTNNIIKCVNALSAEEDVNLDIEKRKWVVFVVNSAIQGLNVPPSNDELFMLGDLWEYLDRPQNYPWNVIDNEYIKCNDIEKMIEIHRRWVLKEVKQLNEFTNPA